MSTDTIGESGLARLGLEYYGRPCRIVAHETTRVDKNVLGGVGLKFVPEQRGIFSHIRDRYCCFVERDDGRIVVALFEHVYFEDRKTSCPCCQRRCRAVESAK